MGHRAERCMKVSRWRALSGTQRGSHIILIFGLFKQYPAHWLSPIKWTEDILGNQYYLGRRKQRRMTKGTHCLYFTFGTVPTNALLALKCTSLVPAVSLVLCIRYLRLSRYSRGLFYSSQFLWSSICTLYLQWLLLYEAIPFDFSKAYSHGLVPGRAYM